MIRIWTVLLPWLDELLGCDESMLTPMDIMSTFISITSGDPLTSLFVPDLLYPIEFEVPTWKFNFEQSKSSPLH